MNANMLKPLFLSLLLAAGGYLAYRFAGPGRGAQPRPPSPELRAAMAAADGLLAEQQAEREAFLARVRASPASPGDFTEGGKYASEFIGMEMRYAEKFNALALPCATCREALLTQGYPEWSADYAAAQLAGMKKFNQAYAAEVARVMSPK